MFKLLVRKKKSISERKSRNEIYSEGNSELLGLRLSKTPDQSDENGSGHRNSSFMETSGIY